MAEKYETVIGLEVHVQLNTRTKAFCGCATEFGNAPNSQTCPVCLGFPGSLPVLNKTALDHAIKVGLALGCQVQDYTKFDRKNYFYPDLPKNYQISQYDLPIAKDGYLDIEMPDGIRRIGIKRVHLEEDAGKLIHAERLSRVDFNRAGIPLLEIVSEPDLRSPQEAYGYLSDLKGIIEYLEVSECDMEKGSLRCDANISVRKKGDSRLGVKSELKNMNSFKAVRDALEFEVARHTASLNDGKPLIQETRLWDVKELKTSPMRTKEEAKDYRYFPEPDLPPFLISKAKIEEIRSVIPKLPKARIALFVKDYGLTEKDAKMLVLPKKNADYAQECFEGYPQDDKKPMVNWLTGPLFSEANSRNCQLYELKIPGGIPELVGLIRAVEKGVVSHLTAKSVLSKSLDSGKPASGIIRDNNLAQVSDSGQLEGAISEVIRENAKSVSDYKQGKDNALMFLVGQVMRKTAGKANPKVVTELLKRRLGNA
ncbi:MAG: Asp-tRNA(Asn)/Glu-tRNA(Gln) amidotransferase subunit GatB [Candidatus Omnitrophota bacterium]